MPTFDLLTIGHSNIPAERAERGVASVTSCVTAPRRRTGRSSGGYWPNMTAMPTCSALDKATDSRQRTGAVPGL
jgi:hypothetical protein